MKTNRWAQVSIIVVVITMLAAAGVSHAAYPLTVGSLLQIHAAKLTASDATVGDYFGHSTAISADTVVVGAYNKAAGGSYRGGAYVFDRNQGGADKWGQVQTLTASDAQDYDFFGFSVAISGDTVVVGADWEDGAGSDRGAAYVFDRNQGGADKWGQVKKLTASDAEDYDRFGSSVAISADTIVIGAYSEDIGGAAYVFDRNKDGADKWGQVKKLTASHPANYDAFGFSVAISADTIVVGADSEDGAGSDRGAAYVFDRDQGAPDNWGYVQKLTASDPADDDLFGASVTISADTVAVGAYGKDGGGTKQGAAYVYERNQGAPDNWGYVQKLTASDPEDWDYFGESLSISADTVVVGAYKKAGAGIERGAAYIYERDQGGVDNWGYVQKLTASDAEDLDYFGCSVGVSSDTVVIGAEVDDGTGSAYIFVPLFNIYLPQVIRDN